VISAREQFPNPESGGHEREQITIYSASLGCSSERRSERFAGHPALTLEAPEFIVVLLIGV
jgi:hypothetical protein